MFIIDKSIFQPHWFLNCGGKIRILPLKVQECPDFLGVLPKGHFTPQNVLKLWQNPMHAPDFGGFLNISGFSLL